MSQESSSAAGGFANGANKEGVEAGSKPSGGGVANGNNTPPPNKTDRIRSSSVYPNNFGGFTSVKTSGKFPNLGSTLGHYFCLGRLGCGTFCSIHKCVNLNYFHSSEQQDSSRLAAAKVEIGEFRNSGVLGGEATMLQFLDSSLPKETVPTYMGHLRAGDDVSAIVMEYLPGQDMHRIRDWATKYKDSRRVQVRDAVYLTARMMLPLLRQMHEVGIVHRDVKPSNVVKRGLKDFCMVDFGLSKSIVVPKESPYSDQEHPWTGKDWIHPPSQSGEGHFRKERESADFRGTSMYASVRVHQLKDYCPRDDLWSLLYVFCDLVSGGLPWMSHAANRNRESCRKLKERVHGEEEGKPEETYRLLMGNDYHQAFYKKFKGSIDIPEGEDASGLPEALPLSKDEKKVDLLRRAFAHLGGLRFFDTPDYDLIKECLEGFLEGNVDDPEITPIDWELLAESTKKKLESNDAVFESVPTWDFPDIEDPIGSSLFAEAEKEHSKKISTGEVVEERLYGEAADLARLPLEMRFRIAQMEYNTLYHKSIAPYLALRDWLKVALPLSYGKWDSKKFEKGGHRSNEDGYRRESYLMIIEKCLKCAAKFNHFRQRDCIYVAGENGSTTASVKRRKILSTIPEPSSGSLGSDLIAISQVSFRLRAEKRAEEKKSRAPPPLLSFGFSNAR